MIEIEFLQDYKCCWKKGQRRAVTFDFAYVMLDLGIARAVDGTTAEDLERRIEEK